MLTSNPSPLLLGGIFSKMGGKPSDFDIQVGMPIFPLEIEEKILSFLGEDDKHLSALKACSLVCQRFLSICRKYIFGWIALLRTNDIHAFERFLGETPEIADYIRELDYNIQIAFENLTSPSIQETFKRISKLKSLTIWDFDKLPDSTGAIIQSAQRCFTSHIFLPSLTPR